MSKQTKQSPKEVSIEEYQRMVSSGSPKPDAMQRTRAIMIAALIILPIIGFVCGMNIQKYPGSQAPTADNSGMMKSGSNGQMMSPGGGPRIMRMGALGKVTTVSDTSITITNNMSGESETFTITADTKLYNGRDAITASGVQVGDTVNIKGMSDDKTIASSIAVTTPDITEVNSVDNSNANSL